MNCSCGECRSRVSDLPIDRARRLTPCYASLCKPVAAESSHFTKQRQRFWGRLIEETNDLACDVFPPRLLVVHDTSRGCEDDVTELTRGQELYDPLLQVAELDVVAGRDDAGLVDAAERYQYAGGSRLSTLLGLPAVELNDDLAIAVVVDLLELANVACILLSTCVLRRIKRASSAKPSEDV